MINNPTINVTEQALKLLPTDSTVKMGISAVPNVSVSDQGYSTPTDGPNSTAKMEINGTIIVYIPSKQKNSLTKPHFIISAWDFSYMSHQNVESLYNHPFRRFCFKELIKIIFSKTDLFFEI